MIEFEKQYTLEEVSKILRCNIMTIRRAIKRGELVAWSYGKKMQRIKHSDLVEFIDSRRGQPKRIVEEDSRRG